MRDGFWFKIASGLSGFGLLVALAWLGWIASETHANSGKIVGLERGADATTHRITSVQSAAARDLVAVQTHFEAVISGPGGLQEGMRDMRSDIKELLQRVPARSVSYQPVGP